MSPHGRLVVWAGWGHPYSLEYGGGYDIENGAPLTAKIHRKFHRMYGNQNNTKAQFLQFLNDEYGIGIERLNHGNHEPSLTIENIQERQKTYKELSLGLKSF